MGYSPWDHKESGTTEWLTLLLSTLFMSFNALSATSMFPPRVPSNLSFF